MKIAIGHYHLNRGGVTRVIENQLLALDRVLAESETHEVLILFGGRADGWPENLADRLQRIRLQLLPVPQLEYDSEGSAASSTLESHVVDALHGRGFKPDETIVHLHNHSIGKNGALPRAVWGLARRGYGLLLQIHDFAEDQRPGNFRLLADAGRDFPNWHGRMYPQAPNVHFAVLNGRDRRVLQSVGIPAGRLHFLPNPVLPIEDLPDRQSARAKLHKCFDVPIDARLILYPVRGIRRKNLGEALLHSMLAPEHTYVAVTLPPLNPVEKVRYDQWKSAAERWQPPFRFDVGAPGGLSFAENLAASDVILTTSIAEGFGMVYLESWLAGRELTGRDLPEITRDFTEAGLNLSALSDRFNVPTGWLNAPHLRRTLLDAYTTTLAAYNRQVPDDLGERVDRKLQDDLFDFGDLDEGFQSSVIERVVSDSSARKELLEVNPWLVAEGRGFGPLLPGRPGGCSAQKGYDPFSCSADLVRSNADVVRGKFSLEPSGTRLASIYGAILSSPRGQTVEPLGHPEAILDRFLEFERFRLLRN